MAIPKSCIQKNYQCQRAFIWGDSSEQKHLHSINWNSICKSKKKGRLGLSNLKVMNKACHAKLGWSFKTRNSSIWSSLMKTKYIYKRLVTSSLSTKPSDYHLWKSIVGICPKLDSLAFWEVGNGSATNIWVDVWVAQGVFLKDHIQL